MGQDVDKTSKAQAVIREYADEIVISTQVINEVCVNLLRKGKRSESDLKALIESFYARYQIAEINERVLLKASALRNLHGLSFWDSLLVATALLANASILFTEDMDGSLTIEQTLKLSNPLV